MLQRECRHWCVRLILLMLLSGPAWGAYPIWTWVKGEKFTQDLATYGTKGVPAPGNKPGNYFEGASWVDSSGRFWFFGGQTNSVSGFDVLISNDLWRFDPATKLWTWVKGSGGSNPNGVYGTLGKAAASNTPGARCASATWTDRSGRLWLFGGVTCDAMGYWGFLNDLWCFDPATMNWTCIKGSSSVNQPGVYGTQGVAAPANTPGGRVGAATCCDAAGRLWLFGGYYTLGEVGVEPAVYNDLWRLDPATGNWTWVKGAMVKNQGGTYGSRGMAAAANTPGARSGSAFTSDNSGRLWLYGGSGYVDPESKGPLSDLWRFDPPSGKWTWIKGSNLATYDPVVSGTLGRADGANTPGSRADISAWADPGGGFWLFGGGVNDQWYNDFWKFDSATENWTCVRGSAAQDQGGVYGTLGQPAAANTPGIRHSYACSGGSGGFWLYGGYGCDASGNWARLTDLWRFDPASAQWTWVKGPDVQAPASVYGRQGTPAAANTPGMRVSAATWTDPAGRFWLFGGAGYDALGKYGGKSDLWRLDPATLNWTWVKGSGANGATGVYGESLTPGATNPAIQPGWRTEGATWTDAAGRLWLFGGEGFATTTTQGMLNDLWRFDPASGNWSWVKGSCTVNESGVYGTSGTAAAANIPGGRSGAAVWTDLSGQVWLLGGSGVSGNLNDLWRFDPVSENWTWIKGSNKANQKGVYGRQGTAAAGNLPGGRARAATWTDHSGRLWLFGGLGCDADGALGHLDDMWRYDPASGEWAWIRGSKYKNQRAINGALGQADPACTPGGRAEAATWVDSAGQLWLYGGRGSSPLSANGCVNDLWRFDPDTMNWAWCGGSRQASQTIVYGTKGKAALANIPGARYGAARWTDRYGRFWFYSGGEIGMDDLWLLTEPNGVARAVWGRME